MMSTNGQRPLESGEVVSVNEKMLCQYVMLG